MKLVPLNVKKWISKQLHRLGFATALIIGTVSFLGGVGGMLLYQQFGGGRDEAGEKIVLQQKVDHLLTSYQKSRSMHLLVQAEGKGEDLALVLPKAQEKDKSLRAVFDAEAQATAIALAHSRQLSPNARYALYKQLDGIDPLPDYFKKTRKDDDAPFVLFSYAQSRVMNRPGFKPSVETAREIVSHVPDNGAPVILGCLFGPLLISIGGMFGYCAARKRLDKSIFDEEKAIEQAKEAADKAEKIALRAQRIAAVARAKAEEAERQRLANLPVAVATALENDISVRQIKLAPREQRPGI